MTNTASTRQARALTRVARRRARTKNLPYQAAREDVVLIHELMGEEELTFEEAEALYDDPGNQLLCETCGWTLAMICPECTGCGCSNGRCTGWRHREYLTDEEREELRDAERCDECGADTSLGSYEECHCG